MKTKFFCMAVIAILLASLQPANAWREKIITVAQLPTQAQTVLKRHFKSQQPVLVKQELEGMRISYDVVFADGSKVEFDAKGEWTEIDCTRSAVPSALIPSQILSFVKRTYPGVFITQIDRDRYGYDVDLSNGLEIEFDKAFRVRDIDD